MRLAIGIAISALGFLVVVPLAAFLMWAAQMFTVGTPAWMFVVLVLAAVGTCTAGLWLIVDALRHRARTQPS